MYRKGKWGELRLRRRAELLDYVEGGEDPKAGIGTMLVLRPMSYTYPTLSTSPSSRNRTSSALRYRKTGVVVAGSLPAFSRQPERYFGDPGE